MCCVASGLTAIARASDRIRVGEADVMIAAGTESMSLVPTMGVSTSFGPDIFTRDENLGIAYGMGLTAEQVATRWKVSRSEEHTSELQSLMRTSYAVFCLKKQRINTHHMNTHNADDRTHYKL